MDTIDAIDIIDDKKIVETEEIDGIEGNDASVGRARRCYHRLRSYADSMLKRKMGLLRKMLFFYSAEFNALKT